MTIIKTVWMAWLLINVAVFFGSTQVGVAGLEIYAPCFASGGGVEEITRLQLASEEVRANPRIRQPVTNRKNGGRRNRFKFYFTEIEGYLWK